MATLVLSEQLLTQLAETFSAGRRRAHPQIVLVLLVSAIAAVVTLTTQRTADPTGVTLIRIAAFVVGPFVALYYAVYGFGVLFGLLRPAGPASVGARAEG